MRPLTFVLLSCLAQGALAATAIIRDGSVGPGADLQPQALGNVTEIDESMGLRPGNGVNLLRLLRGNRLSERVEFVSAAVYQV